MEISLFLDDTAYHGTAVPYEKPDSMDTLFVVRLEGQPVFHLSMTDNGEWTSGDSKSGDLISAVGAEITRRDGVDPSAHLESGRYYSAGLTGGVSPVIENGEIINEPDDVDEQSFTNS